MVVPSASVVRRNVQTKVTKRLILYASSDVDVLMIDTAGSSDVYGVPQPAKVT